MNPVRAGGAFKFITHVHRRPYAFSYSTGLGHPTACSRMDGTAVGNMEEYVAASVKGIPLSFN